MSLPQFISGKPYREVSVSDAISQRLIENADCLLWRPTSLEGIGIKRLVRADYVHVGLLCWQRFNGDEIVWVLEQIKPQGRAILLEPYILENKPTKADVYGANPGNRWPEFDRFGTVRWAIHNIPGKRYGFASLRLAMLSHLPFTRLFFRPNTDDKQNGGNKYLVCSAAVARSYRIGGSVDPIKNLSDNWSEPQDLARSSFLEYKFTLVH